jgi:hypothetical protein
MKISYKLFRSKYASSSLTLTDIAERITQSFSLEDSRLFLGVALKSRLPRFEAAHQILEI